MKLVFSFDDGHITDLKLAKLLEKYGFTGTFYIPSMKMFNSQSLEWNEVRRLYEKGHQIGGHTINHPMDLKMLNENELDFEIGENKTSIEYFTQVQDNGLLPHDYKQVESFCYPRGRYNEIVIEAVKRAGFKEARTTKVLNTDLPDKPFEIETTLHLFPNRTEYEGKDLMTVFNEQLEIAEKKGDKGYFHIWGHSWEMNEHNLWETFETMLKILNQKGYGK